jgi:hypothetical protein
VKEAERQRTEGGEHVEEEGGNGTKALRDHSFSYLENLVHPITAIRLAQLLPVEAVSADCAA